MTDRIGQCCVDALRAEVAATPKPGLVDRKTCGAHRDMDYDLFLSSIEAIAPFMKQLADHGCRLKQVDHATLDGLRATGLACEAAMYRATHGVNTHKGAIFSLGLVAVAAGYCASVLYDLRAATVCRVVALIARPAERAFHETMVNGATTHGEHAFVRHGIRGIRGEAAAGFPSVRETALPVLRSLTATGRHGADAIHVQTLLHLMRRVEDTNVIARAGIGALDYVRHSAERALALGGALTPEGLLAIEQLDREFTRNNISPGGCADLLAIAIALEAIERIQTRQEGPGKPSHE